MMKSILGVATAAALLTACGQKADEAAPVEGPAVSTSETPRNEAVDTTPTADPAALTPGANSFTQDQAKGAIESAGYTAVGPLTQGADGVWQGKATKDGAEATVAVDYKGAVVAK